MRDNREKWTFVQHPSKPTISSSEVMYWKGTLQKVLKVGVEFELNLPEQKGNCKGNSMTCPCVNMSNSDCWKECRNMETCKTTPVYQVCSNKSKKCKPKDCAKCKDFQLDCQGLFCPGFISVCFGCADYTTNCESCSQRFNPKKNPDHIRENIIHELMPSNCYGHIAESGVHSITTDGSLLGKKGVEIITIGRRINYREFYKMSKRILDSSVGRGAYMNERCSTHMHVLASYYGKLAPNTKDTGIPTQINEFERDMPEIILANFHQLCRRYQNAMTWMTMALDDPQKMTRWEKFRVSVLQISAILDSMQRVKEKIHRNSGNNKYGWVNYDNMLFGKGGGVKRFHVELRGADGIMCPSAVAAVACMYYALVIKAVEISKYGIVEVGDEEWLERSIQIKEAMMNNMKDYNAGDRFSHTKHLHKYYDDLVAESHDLVRQLKHILIKIGPAYRVLEKLADRPIALRRCDGEDWDAIERDIEIPMTEQGKFELVVDEFVDLRLVTECDSMEEWVEAVTRTIQDDKAIAEEIGSDIGDRVKTYVMDKRNEGELIWSDTLGTVVLL